MRSMIPSPEDLHSNNDYTLQGADLSDFGFPFLPEVCRISYRFINSTSDEHVHPGRIEVLYLHGGCSLPLSVGGRRQNFHPGNCFISRPDEPHCITTFPKGARYYWYSFRIPMSRETIPGLSRAETRQLTDALTNATNRIFAGSPRLRDAFERILALAAPETAPSGMLNIRMRTAALDLLTETVGTLERPPLTPRKSVTDHLAAEMSAHPEQDFPLRKIAVAAGISVSGLSAKFKAATGMTPHAYLIDRRINRAKELLKSGQSATAIANSLGFASYTHFSALFHAHTGICPADFRRDKLSLRSKWPQR